jgi:hypothetical protein
MMRISAIEAGILDDIDEIGFGELYDLTTGKDGPEISKVLSSRRRHFISALRRELYFDKVIVHDSEPQYAIKNSETCNGRRCQIKFKF